MRKPPIPYGKIADLAVLGMAIAIPSGVYFLTLPFLILLAVCRLLQKDNLWQPETFKDPTFYLPAAIYLYVVMQFFFSQNRKEALSSLSTELPFLLYPLILGAYRGIDETLKRRAEKCFLFSIVLFLLIAIVYATIDTALTHQNTIVLGGDSSYNKFSSYGLARVFYNWHPTNAAMSAVLGIFILFRLYGPRLREKRKLSSFIVPVLIFLFLSLSLFLLNSIAAIVAYIAILLYGTFVFLRRDRVSLTIRIVLLCTLVCGATGFLYINPFSIEKIEELKNRNLKVTDSYVERNILTMRLAKWQTHMHIIREHLPWGTTVGDIKQIREEAYRKANFQDLALHNYNAHDQFIEYLTIFGIPGILLFLAMLVAPLSGTAPRKPYIGFILIVIIIFLTESLLQRQQGLNFFMFFYALYGRREIAETGNDKAWRPSSLSTATLVILVLTAILVMQFLYNRSLWLDEAMLSLNIIKRSFTGLLHPMDYNQVAPVLFLLIEKGFTWLFGNAEMALRLFPLICSVLSLVLIYRCGAVLTKNRRIALIACGLLGFTPKFIYFASEVKQYATDVTVLLAIYLAAFSENAIIQRHRAVILSLTGAVAIFLSNISVVPLCTAGAWLFYQAIRKGKERKAVFISLSIWILCFAANYLLFIKDHPSTAPMKTYWAAALAFMPANPFSASGHEWLSERFHQIFFYLLPDLRFHGYYFINIIPYVAGLLFLIIKKNFRLAYLCIMPVLLHLGLSYLKMYPFDLRLILYQLPLYILVMANGIHGLTIFVARNPRYSMLLAGLLTIAFSRQVFQMLPMKCEELRPMIREVNHYVKPGESAYVYSGAWAAFLYYKEIGVVQFGNIPIRIGTGHFNDNAAYAAELRDWKGHVWVLFSHGYPSDGSRGDERYMIKDLQRRGHILMQFEDYNSAAYLIDLW